MNPQKESWAFQDRSLERSCLWSLAITALHEDLGARAGSIGNLPEDGPARGNDSPPNSCYAGGRTR